jgi:hypothetical protein
MTPTFQQRSALAAVAADNRSTMWCDWSSVACGRIHAHGDGAVGIMATDCKCGVVRRTYCVLAKDKPAELILRVFLISKIASPANAMDFESAKGLLT